MDFTYHRFQSTSSLDFIDILRYSETHSPQTNGDVMAEFRNNGREVDNTTECSETSRYTRREVSKEVKKDKDTRCHLFKNNGSINYRSHQLKDNEGKIVCPVLQMYVCPICGATGPDSHTKNNCPWNVNRMAVPVMKVLKSGRKTTGDVTAEFRNNGREVDNTPECSETSRYIRREVSKEVKQDQDTWCRLCKNNGSSNYRSHQLKDNEGKIVCPVLQMYVCPICGATGPDSHTKNNCPWNVNRMAVPVMKVLKSGRKTTGDVMAEFSDNGREVDNTPECSETSRYIRREVSKEVKQDQDTWCRLCKNNGSSNYRSHQLKDNEGKIVCPVLRMYVCPICGATGPDSHTENNCPWNVNRMAVPVMKVLKSGRKTTGDVMAEFSDNGREVDNTPECSETSRYIRREVSKEVKQDQDTWCRLCKNNGSSNYRSHKLKDNEGKIVCPVLQMYVCPICGATGPDSHTENYCPWNVNRMAVPLMNVLKSGRKATGKFGGKRKIL